MIYIINETYERAYFITLEKLLSEKYKIKNDKKIAYETNACLSFNHLVDMAEIIGGRFISNYNYDMIIPKGNQQMQFELEYYKKLFIDTMKIDYVVKTLYEDSSSKHAVIKVSNEYDPQLPCQMYQFIRILNGKIHANAHMRANNGFGLLLMDMHLNNAIVAYVAKELRIPVSQYTHFVDSLHLYKRDLDIDETNHTLDLSTN
ncbi:MAG: hypothetical protein LBD23_12065 [Oscillospiraceae bacterium]|jgi:thymidylate synthase|nr:hypothetical protein [Oscillospiraceae bacterium]